jgi:hypothetical protein
MQRIKRLILLTGLLANTHGWAATTINPTNNFAYGSNIGWLNARGDIANGLQIGRYYCAGYLYGANVGWINMGGGNPANAYAYQNNATDFGVNTDGTGNLRGYAWGANIGWINFENQGAAKVDLRTGQLSGYAYSANCGWISLSNSYAKVVTDSLWPGQMENGMAKAWEFRNFGWSVDPNEDADSDGASNLNEYLAGTDPKNEADRLVIVSMIPTRNAVDITWQSNTERNYYLQYSDNLTGPWSNSTANPMAPDGQSTTRAVSTSGTARFYRVQAVPVL